MGYLGAWLAQGLHSSLDTKAKHWFEGNAPTRAQRVAFRTWLKSEARNPQDLDAKGILGAEADKWVGEESEPEGEA